MNHEVTEEGKAIVVALEGDVDLSSSPDARKILLECVRKGRPVIVDMAGVSYIDQFRRRLPGRVLAGRAQGGL